MTFPSRSQAEITCGRLVSWPDLGSLGCANERQTFESIQRYELMGGRGLIDENIHGYPHKCYVVHGCVQHKETGKRYTGFPV